jgi:predicted dehydrogenase
VIEGVCVWDVGKYEVEDFVAAFIRFEDDSVLLLKESWTMHANTLGSSFFLGDKGGLRLKPLEVYRDEAGYMVNITPQLPKTEWFDADSLKVFEEAIGRPRSQWDDLNRAKIISFVEAIRHGKPSPITPAEMVLEQCVLESIYKSASLKREVTFKLPKELLEGD